MTTATASALTPESMHALGARTGEPEWLTVRRLDALATFEGLPWPDPSSEEWRYTDLTEFHLGEFHLAEKQHPRAETLDGVPAEVQVALGDVGERAALAVLVDGQLVHASLDPAVAARGVVFTDLATAAREHEDLVRKYVGKLGTPASEAKLTTLGAAIAGGGMFLHVPRGVEVALPLQSFRWIAENGIITAAHTVIVAEESASVTYVDHHASADGRRALSLGVVEIYAHPGANVSYLAVQDHASEVFHFHVQRAEVHRDATVRSLAATLGGKLARSVVESHLVEPGAYSEMLGVYFGDGEQHIDNRSLQEHTAPHTKSELMYKGALKGRSRAVYSGLIHIAKDAQKVDSYQANRNLVLSDHAKADSIPYLEIEANDVRCAHAASVGPPDADQVFYLRTRGLDAAEAERTIVRGFFQEVLDRVRVPEVREALERAVEAELELEE